MNTVHNRLPVSDLNLLRLFAVLMEERSVTRAGERLALSQSAVSHGLARLRHALEDELFVRSAQGMRPTPRAQEIAPGVAQALAQLQQAIAPRRFRPEESNRRFRLAASPYLCAVLLPAVVERFRRDAPAASLSIRHVVAGVAEALDGGRVDAAIGGFGHVPERLESQRLFDERMVWAFSADNAAARRPLSLAELARLPQLVIATEEPEDAGGGRVFEHGLERRVIWDDQGAFAGALAESATAARVRVTAPDAHAALALLPGSDLVALLPRRLAEPGVRAGRLAFLEAAHPGHIAEISAIWRRERAADPALIWLLSLLREASARLEPR